MEVALKNTVLQLMFEFGVPYTDCDIEFFGRDVQITFKKGDHADRFRFGWNGAQFVFLGIINKKGEIEEYSLSEKIKKDANYESYKEIILSMHKFFLAAAKSMTDEKYKNG